MDQKAPTHPPLFATVLRSRPSFYTYTTALARAASSEAMWAKQRRMRFRNTSENWDTHGREACAGTHVSGWIRTCGANLAGTYVVFAAELRDARERRLGLLDAAHMVQDLARLVEGERDGVPFL